MMAFRFREFTNLLDETERKVAKRESPLDAMSFLSQLPAWGLCVKELSLRVSGGISPRQGVQVLLTGAAQDCALP
jgi:hypothetical protein